MGRLWSMLMEGKPNTRRDRIVISLVFAIHGTVTGTFASRLPWTAHHVHATPGSLGAVLITPTLGALVAMPATGGVVHKLGTRGAMRLLLALWTAALALPGFMPNVGLLAVALTCYGASAGAADVVMNGYAVRIEERAGKSIMSGLHGMWSVGGILGGLLGALCAGAGISALPEFLVTAGALTVITLCATSLLPADAAAEGQIRPPRFALPSRAVLGIGVIGFCAVFAEGSGSDWSAVYLTSVAHASAAVGAYCVTGFAATMAVGRLSGDRIVRRYGPVWTVRVGGAIAAAGAVVIVLARQPAAGIVGFAALGLGIATVVPLAFAAAGRRGGDTESSVAGIATITYTSGLLAGPSIGALGSAFSLSFAFGVVALLGCGMAVGAFTLGQRTSLGQQA